MIRPPGATRRAERKDSILRAYPTVALALLACAIGAGPSKAQTLERVTLDEAVERFARHGLPLQIARSEARAATERARQDAAWPNPTLAAAREDLRDADAEYSETTIDLAQPIVWPWRWSARRSTAEAVEREASSRFRADSAAAVSDLVETWLEAWKEERVLEVLETATGVFREADRAAEARFEEGDLSGFDLRRLRVERARYEADLAAGGVVARAARRRLATLIAPGSPVEEIGAEDPLPPVAPSPTMEAALERARAASPRLAATRAAVESARAELAAARGSRVPEPTLRAGYKEQSDGLDGLVLGLSIPVPVFDRRGAATNAARARLDEATARARLVARRVEEEVRRAVELHAALLERAEFQRERLLGEADDLLEIARVSYGAGEISLIELLDAVDAWRDALEMRVRLEAELVESEHELRRAIGGPIEPRIEEGR